MSKTEARDVAMPETIAWRWVIAGSCSLINFFVFSIFRSAGVLYLALITTFNCSREEASWPVTLASGISAIVCLPAGFLSHYFAIRSIVVAGILVSSLGIGVCIFANSIAFIILFLGIVQGVGIGLVTVLLPVIISEYFGQQRAAAVGLSYAGATVGAFIFPIFFQYLVDNFSLRGSLLLMGAINLNALIGALFLRPRSQMDYAPVATSRKSPLPSPVRKSLVAGEDARPAHLGLIDGHRAACASHERSDGNPRREDDGEGEGEERAPAKKNGLLPEHLLGEEETSQMNRICCDEDRSLRREYDAQKTSDTVGFSLLNDTSAHHVSLESAPSNSKQTEINLLQTIKQHLRQDVKILKNPYFALITYTYISFIISNVTLLMILPDFAIDCGLDRDRGVLLLSLYSVTDLFGRLLPGWLSYCRLATNKTLFVASITLIGTLLILYPVILSGHGPDDTTFLKVLAMTLSFGFAAGCQMSLAPVIVSECIGREHTAVGFGFANFLLGLVSFGRPFLIGYIKDRTNKYDDVFYLLGSFALTSACAWITEMLYTKARTSRKRLDSVANFTVERQDKVDAAFR